MTPDGGLAQLGEHLLCKQGVIGSIPIVSTKTFGVEASGARLAWSTIYGEEFVFGPMPLTPKAWVGRHLSVLQSFIEAR